MLLICIVNTVETRLSNAEDFAFKLLLAKVLISGAVENNLASLMNWSMLAVHHFALCQHSFIIHSLCFLRFGLVIFSSVKICCFAIY